MTLPKLDDQDIANAIAIAAIELTARLNSCASVDAVTELLARHSVIGDRNRCSTCPVAMYYRLGLHILIPAVKPHAFPVFVERNVACIDGKTYQFNAPVSQLIDMIDTGKVTRFDPPSWVAMHNLLDHAAG